MLELLYVLYMYIKYTLFASVVNIVVNSSPCAFRRLNVKFCQQAIHECCIFECSKCIENFALQQGQINEKIIDYLESLIVITFFQILQSLDNMSNKFLLLYFDLLFIHYIHNISLLLWFFAWLVNLFILENVNWTNT